VREMQLIYASRPFGYDELTLVGILASARRNNERDGITGALICRDDLFVQLLEGRRDVVTAAFSRILHDDRHVDVVNLWSGDIDTRLFPGWSMRHDPARSWMWTPEQVAGGAIGRASMQEIRGIFDRLAKEPPERPMGPSATPEKCPDRH
jgi:FAD-dependent sensor of blue light